MLEKIKMFITIKESSYRSMRRAIENMTFQSIFFSSDLKRQQKLYEIVQKGDLESFKQWVRDERQKQLSLMQTCELREKAKDIGVLNFTILTKSCLVDQIAKAENKKAEIAKVEIEK